MPTLETIIERAAGIGLPVAFVEFKDTKQNPAPEPPFLIYLYTEKQRGSDDRNRIREISASLELYTDRVQDPELEARIENEVLFDVDFTKFPLPIHEENMFQSAYDFTIIQKIRREI